MGKFISLGEYNKQYKYIWIYLVIRFIYLFIFANNLVFKQIETEVVKLPYGPFIYPQFDFAACIIIPSVLKIIPKCFKKKESIQDLIGDELIYNERDIIKEFGVERSDYFLFINIFLVVIKDLFNETTYKFNCLFFNFWMFEMLYYELFHSKYFKTKINKHHICSLIFILSLCSVLKIIQIILSFIYDTDEAKFFEKRMWIIPVALVVYFLYRVFRAFTMCNEKYYFEKRYITIINYIFLYGLYGLITTLIGGIISTYVPCGDKNIPELSRVVCDYVENNQTYYFDSYKIFFTKLHNDEYFISKLILLIVKSILNFVKIYYIYVIYQKLSPIYYICMHRFDTLLVTILTIINKLVNDEIEGINITLQFFDIIILIFYILGSIVYLEFIELNYCNLQFYTKRNIKKRSNTEVMISLDEISESSDLVSKENDES